MRLDTGEVYMQTLSYKERADSLGWGSVWLLYISLFLFSCSFCFYEPNQYVVRVVLTSTAIAALLVICKKIFSRYIAPVIGLVCIATAWSIGFSMLVRSKQTTRIVAEADPVSSVQDFVQVQGLQSALQMAAVIAMVLALLSTIVLPSQYLWIFVKQQLQRLSSSTPSL